jgi:hypothetical protein
MSNRTQYKTIWEEKEEEEEEKEEEGEEEEEEEERVPYNALVDACLGIGQHADLRLDQRRLRDWPVSSNKGIVIDVLVTLGGWLGRQRNLCGGIFQDERYVNNTKFRVHARRAPLMLTSVHGHGATLAVLLAIQPMRQY